MLGGIHDIVGLNTIQFTATCLCALYFMVLGEITIDMIELLPVGCVS